MPRPVVAPALLALPSPACPDGIECMAHPSTPICCAGEFAQASGREVAALLKAAGAKQLSRPPAAAPTPRAGAGPCTSLILCEAPEPGAAGSPAAALSGGGGQQAVGQAAEEEAGEQEQQQRAQVPPAVAAAKW